MTTTEVFEQWAILELMGHVKLAGRVTDEHRRGADKATIKLQREILTGPGGKRKITDEQTIEPGQPMPDLRHFGLSELTPMERIEGFTPARVVR